MLQFAHIRSSRNIVKARTRRTFTASKLVKLFANGSHLRINKMQKKYKILSLRSKKKSERELSER